MSYRRLIVLRVEMADPKDVIGMIHKVSAVQPHQRSVTDAPFERLIQISGKASFSKLVFVKPAVQSAMSASAIRMSGYREKSPFAAMITAGRFALASLGYSLHACTAWRQVGNASQDWLGTW